MIQRVTSKASPLASQKKYGWSDYENIGKISLMSKRNMLLENTLHSAQVPRNKESPMSKLINLFISVKFSVCMIFVFKKRWLSHIRPYTWIYLIYDHTLPLPYMGISHHHLTKENLMYQEIFFSSSSFLSV